VKSIERISNQYLTQVNFHEKRKSIIDIQCIFDESIQSYKQTLENFGLDISFNFKNRTNKRFFFNELVKTYIQMLKKNDYLIYFFRCELIPNDFQNPFIKKLKSIFGISLLDSGMDLSTLIYFYEKGYSEQVEIVDSFLMTRNGKNFRKIKKFLEKEGLFYLYDECVYNISNKMSILMH